MKHILLGATALTLVAGMASATTFNYDFKAEANGSGDIGEAIFDVFNTSTNGVFAGPNLQVTATKDQSSAFVYFDAGDAGMGVCGEVGSSLNTYNPGSGANRCKDSSDDGLTTTGESLHFKATEKAMRITSFFINSNHDKGDILDTVWNIGGTSYDSSDFTSVGGGDVRIDVNYLLDFGATLSLFGERGPNSYISAIAVEAVPVPAAGLLLLAGLGGLGMMRKRKKS